MGCITMNLKPFDVLLDNKLSIIRLYLFCYVFTIFFFFVVVVVEEQRWPKRVAVLLDPSILLGKKSAASRSKYL